MKPILKLTNTIFFLIAATAINEVHAENIFSRMNNNNKYSFPLLFTKNIGQWSDKICFGSSLGKTKFELLNDGILFLNSTLPTIKDPVQIHNDEIYFCGMQYCGYRFINPATNLRIIEKDCLSKTTNFYKGSESDWRINIPSYRTIVYKNVWKNIDIIYCSENDKLSQTIVIYPDGKLSDVQFAPLNSKETHGTEDIFSSLTAFQKLGTKDKTVPNNIKKEEDSFTFSSSGGNSKKPLYIRSEFSTYFGGSSLDDVSKVLVDHQGNIYIYGWTNSVDFPIINSSRTYQGNGDVFVYKFACDGKQLLFSTIIGGEQMERSGFMALGKEEKTIYLLGSTSSKSFPVFGRTRRTSLGTLYSDNFITRISENGTIIGSGYFGNESVSGFVGISVDTTNNVVWLGGQSGESVGLTYITPDALMKNEPGGSNCIIVKMNVGCDTILYASYLGGKSEDKITNLEIDRQGNPIFVGITESNDFPIKNAYQFQLQGASDYFVTKIHSSGTSLLFSTFLGGIGEQSGITIFVDDKDKNYVLCEIYGGFPVTQALDSTPVVGSHGIGIAKFTSQGDLIFSTALVGIGSTNASPSSITADSCGNIFVSGWTDNKSFPLVKPLQILPMDSFPEELANFLTVIDPSGKHILLSTHWGYKGAYSGTGGGLSIDKAQYVYFSNSAKSDVPVYNGYQMQTAGGSDVFLTRFHFNFCDPNYLQCQMLCIDSVRIETAHKAIFPERFPITIPIRNIDQLRTAQSIEGELILSPGLVLDPPSQQLHQILNPSKLKPGEGGAFTWFVRVDTTAIQDSVLMVSIDISYSDSSLKDFACVMLYSHCEKEIKVKYYQDIIRLYCDMITIDALKVDSLGASYSPDPFTVQYTLRNIDTKIAKLNYVELQLPSGFETIPQNDARKVIAPLAQDNTANFSWTIHPRGVRRMTNALFRVVAIDTNGFEQSRCEKIIVFLPIKQEMLCASDAIDTLKYDKSSGTYNPSSFFVNFKLENRIDTIQTNVYGELPDFRTFFEETRNL